MTLTPDARKAIHLALQSAGPGETILVAGSLFLVGDVKKAFPH